MIRTDRDIPSLQAIAVSDVVLAKAEAAACRSGLLETVEALMAQGTGRPRALSWRTVLTLVLITAVVRRGSLMTTDILRVVAGLTPFQRQRLHLGSDPVRYCTIDGAINDLASRAATQAIDPATGEVRETDRFDDLLGAIVTCGIPADLLTLLPRGVALDSTDIETWARRRGWGNADVETDPDPDTPTGPSRRSSNEPGWPRVGHDGRAQPSVDPDA